jgi:Bifunctional DNA primase/polymerase, N-terminal
MIRAAITLATRGLHVFPCRPRTKKPVCEHGCKDATTDLGVIRQWWRSEPQANVAIATGEVSGVFAIDVDDIDAESALSKLETEHGALPPTVAVITGKGRHLYFRWPGEPVRCSVSKIAPGIDASRKHQIAYIG